MRRFKVFFACVAHVHQLKCCLSEFGGLVLNADRLDISSAWGVSGAPAPRVCVEKRRLSGIAGWKCDKERRLSESAEDFQNSACILKEVFVCSL